MGNKPRYLIRPSDYHIFDLDESNGCYRSFSTKDVMYPCETRIQAHYTYTLDNLVEKYDFFPIEESELDEYIKKNNLYCEYITWTTRPDGHGGIKGGTYGDFIRTLDNK